MKEMLVLRDEEQALTLEAYQASEQTELCKTQAAPLAGDDGMQGALSAGDDDRGSGGPELHF